MAKFEGFRRTDRLNLIKRAKRSEVTTLVKWQQSHQNIYTEGCLTLIGLFPL
jgi:hypothetical protein